ncbi:hypothetical protein POPTR_009G023001v4 [Populus trichocarpa]|uniref:Uncharacterized protein n=1 Tax=Populus trichocarpa TaxID=3694 RepID=A0ACC0SG19_POPTR|nr:hypothetical protein POPTR_009G023001v4 [Populus trichocarpa]
MGTELCREMELWILIVMASLCIGTRRKECSELVMVPAAARMALKALTFYPPYMKFRSGPLSYLSTLEISRLFMWDVLFSKFSFQQFLIWMMAGRGFGERNRIIRTDGTFRDIAYVFEN